MCAGIGFDGEAQRGIIAETDQILAHARVDRAGRGGMQRIVQVEQRSGPVGEIETAAMLRAPDARDQRIGAESRQHLLVTVDALFHLAAQFRGNWPGRRNQHAGAERVGKRRGMRHAPRE